MLSLALAGPCAVGVPRHALHRELPATAVAVLHLYRRIALQQLFQVEAAAEVGQCDGEVGNFRSLTEDTVVGYRLSTPNGVCVCYALYRRVYLIVTVRAIKEFGRFPDA